MTTHIWEHNGTHAILTTTSGSLHIESAPVGWRAWWHTRAGQPIYFGQFSNIELAKRELELFADELNALNRRFVAMGE